MENLVKEKLFNNSYFGKRVLVTGHTGFKGSWLCFWLHQMGAQVTGYSLSDSTSPSHFSLMKLDIKTHWGDVRNNELLEKVMLETQPEVVFHLAAQSLVRESYRDPLLTYSTNVTGTLNVFEAARKCPGVKAIVNVTTDKVYENKEQLKAYSEADRLGGHDLYSSSKACSEILTSSYRHSFFKDNAILLGSARAGNVIGGGDWAHERLIPDLVRGAATGKETEIRSPGSTRPWEHVLEPLSGYLLLGQKLLEGKPEYADAWNFGPSVDDTLKVGEVIDLMQKHWQRIRVKVNEEEAKKFHEAGILMLDCSKALRQLSWKPVWGMHTTIMHTANWYRNFYEQHLVNTWSDLQTYVADAKNKSLIWTQK